MNNDNIVAIATASGYSGIGIVRISGTNLLNIAKQLIRKDLKLKPRVAYYTDFIDKNNETIDSGLILFFKAPNSFTGEDILELNSHGSPVILQMLLNRCIELDCRLAKPGEFSQRAYLNNKIDLLQAESIIDLINADSEAAARSAIKSLKGTFSHHISIIKEQLINLRMFIEATLDFPEEDIEFIANNKIHEKLKTLKQNIYKLLNITKQGVLLNNGANLVIIGRPNVGKSSLLNALANEDIAIVTDIAGTTRDIIKEKIIINGITFNIIDTAGIRNSTDIVETIGIKKALEAINIAEICLILIDQTEGITNADTEILKNIPPHIPKLFIHNKIDLTNDISKKEVVDESIHIYISAKNNIGLDLLRNTLLEVIGFNHTNQNIFIARSRHLIALKAAVNHIDHAFANWSNLEILAEELRYSHSKLGEITGEYTSDELLGEIFSKFCIGK